MQTLNLLNSFLSEIKYEISNFPDGHIHIKLLGDFNKSDIEIKCRIRNANDLFILQQVANICKINKIKIAILYISYLFTSRMDRHMSIGESHDLEIVCNTINQLNAEQIFVQDPHSSKIYDYLKNIKSIYLAESYSSLLDKYRICFPDNGAKDRINNMNYDSYLEIFNKDPIICSKTRINTDIKIYIQNESKWKKRYKRRKTPILVLDDLCDGGLTFVKVAEQLRLLKPRELSIFVTHVIQMKGILQLSEYYDKVYISNSFNEWEFENLPKNVHTLLI